VADDRNANAGGPIRVLLADDQVMFREGLAVLLASLGGMEVVAGVPNDDDVPRLVRELRPDVVVAEVRTPFERARETLRRMLSPPSPPGVVICTALESRLYAARLTGAGASAFVLKTSPAGHLAAAVRAAASAGGNVVLGMPRSMLGGTEEAADGVLTKRELEVLLLASRGASNRQMASGLYLAEGTVKRHLSNAYEKMGVGSRGEAAREALLKNWITAEEITDPAFGHEDPDRA